MTKEERISNAKNQYVYPNFPTCSEDYLNGFETGYIIGSTEQDPISRAEQRKEDIEKACQTMESFMSFYHIDRELMFRISKDVRKAMEE